MSKKLNEMIDKRYYYKWHINTIVPLREDVESIKRKLGMAGTERKCAGGCGRPARKGSNFCKYYFVEPGWGCDPALPLNARVAKALGYKIIKRQNGQWSMPRSSMEQEYIEYIPPYDQHVDLAMGALEDYCAKCDHTDFEIFWHKGDYCIEIFSQFGKREPDYRRNMIYASKPLPQAICEAIAKHSEAK